jgi:hypothetical protein
LKQVASEGNGPDLIFSGFFGHPRAEWGSLTQARPVDRASRPRYKLSPHARLSAINGQQ